MGVVNGSEKKQSIKSLWYNTWLRKYKIIVSKKINCADMGNDFGNGCAKYLAGNHMSELFWLAFKNEKGWAYFDIPCHSSFWQYPR